MGEIEWFCRKGAIFLRWYRLLNRHIKWNHLLDGETRESKISYWQMLGGNHYDLNLLRSQSIDQINYICEHMPDIQQNHPLLKLWISPNFSSFGIHNSPSGKCVRIDTSIDNGKSNIEHLVRLNKVRTCELFSEWLMTMDKRFVLLLTGGLNYTKYKCNLAAIDNGNMMRNLNIDWINGANC